MFEKFSTLTDKKKRTFVARIALYLSVFFLVATIINGAIYPKAYGDFRDAFRFLWAITFVFLGLSIRAWRYQNTDGSPYKAYFKYVVYLVPVNIMVFALCHTTLGIDNWIYYPVAAIAGLFSAQSDGIPEKMPGALAKLVGIECERN